MRKTFTFIAMFLAISSAVWAKPVSLERAQTIAMNFWTSNAFGKWSEMNNVTSLVDIEEMYVFAGNNGGYVIVSADDCALPILGYSPTSRMQAPLPDNMLNWLRAYAWEIKQMREHGVEASNMVSSQWAELENASVSPRKSSIVVSPLITTTWSQGTYYNNMCPVDNSSQHAAVGCVATATAQVMKYWNHPVQGRGSRSYNHPTYGQQSADFGNTTYDWTNMPVSLNANSSTAQVQAVSTLMYHVGVSIVTNYATSSNGSSAEVVARNGINYPCVENALRQYFDYSPEIFGARLSGMGDDNWRNLLKNELDNARPVIYTGYDFSGGHCFVCDGYDSQNRFHFNWGWGGMSDGYFAIGSLNPSVGGIGTNASSSFNLDNMAVMGIRPAERNNPNTSTITVTSDDPSHTTITGAGTYNNFSDLVTLTVNTVDGYRFDKWSDGSRTQPRTFWANGDVNLTAHIVPVVGDTIAYCGNAYEANLTNRYYGIKIEANDLPANRSIRSVQLFNVYEGDYHIKIYAGDNYSPGIVAYEEVFHLNGTNSWETLRLSQPYTISNSQPLWVIAYCNNNNYPAPLTSYCGNQNGGWTSINGQVWQQLSDLTFLMRVILTQPNDVIITAQASDASQGTVQGGGRYAMGESCTITAIPVGDNTFDHWSDGNTDNPRTFNANTTATYTAYFSSCGIGNSSVQDFSDGLDCWTTYSASSANESEMEIYSYSGMWGSYAYFKFCSMNTSTYYDQYLISPRLLTSNAKDLSLTYSSYSNTTETFSLVYSTTDNSPSSFTHVITSASSNQSTWQTLIATIPAEAKYFAIHYTTQHGYYLYIDDINIVGQPLPNRTITAQAEYEEMGTVTGGGVYEEGTPATLEAIPGSCYEFVRWQDGNIQNPRTIVVNADETYTAIFTPITVYENDVISACDSVEWHGNWYYESTSSISFNTTTVNGCDSVVNLVLTINHSAEVDTTIEAIGEYELNDIVYTQSTTLEQVLTTATGCDSIVNINLVINPIIYTITATSEDETMGLVSGGGEYEAGSLVELIATAKDGYVFVDWSDGTTANPYQFQAVEDVALVGRFQEESGLTDVKNNINIWTIGNELYVQGAEGKQIQVVDILGKEIVKTNNSANIFRTTLPHTATYIVKINNTFATKIVVK
ncbi:MAG: C10 family peptidase [Bacteroidales bacterium]|nr:C10 family peptidase [Candidatus Scybalousia scybalohippi]